MTGFVGFAPVYLNGLLAIYVAFFLPGMVLVRVLDIPGFPQRWLAVVLSSLAANHLLVTLIAALHLDPLLAYRLVVTALVAALLFIIAMKRARSGASILLLSDVKWLLGTLIVLGFTYSNVWKHGVPNIFQGSDVSVSWNAWSLIWSHGLFPIHSYGYPQFIPTIWAITYIFTGSTEQYFAYYTYIVFIVLPLVLCAAVLARGGWLTSLIPMIVFVWFIAEIREPWLRFSLQAGFPDWIAATFSFCGTVLFITNAPEGRLDREKVVNALLALCLVSIAATTKPLCGLLALAILAAICADAAKHLEPRQRNGLIIAAVGLVSIFVAAYLIYYSHLTVRSMPYYALTTLSERISRAVKLLNSNFTLPFRILIFAGLALSPFVPRIRWLALPLLAGFGLWANTASYDLRNLLGLVLISAFIPLYTLARRFTTAGIPSNERRWNVRDGAVAAGLAAACLVLTLPLALGDEKLKQRFDKEQLSRGFGLEINQSIERLLVRGCTVFTADGYLSTISTFQRFINQIPFYHLADPLTDAMTKQTEQSTGCIGIFYPTENVHPSVLRFIMPVMEARGYTKVIEHNGMTLLATNEVAPAEN